MFLGGGCLGGVCFCALCFFGGSFLAFRIAIRLLVLILGVEGGGTGRGDDGEDSAGTGESGGGDGVVELEFCGGAGFVFFWLVFDAVWGAEAGARLFFFWVEVDAGSGAGFGVFLGWLGGVLGVGVGLRLFPEVEAICSRAGCGSVHLAHFFSLIEF